MGKPKTSRKGGAKKVGGSSDARVGSKERRALAALLARHGAIDEAHRSAFDALATDADRAALGGETKAAGVVREAVAWCVEIDRAFAEHPQLIERHYARARFAYLLDRAVALADALGREGERSSRQGTERESAAEREAMAREARLTLLAKLRGFAGKREEERRALAEAAGRTDDTTALRASIDRLAALGRGWLARAGTAARIQRDSAGLTEALVERAVAAGEALVGAATDATLAGRRRAKDAPEINVLEGGVLIELEEAGRCFDEARAESPLAPKLVPGPATRHVLGSKRRSPKEEESPTPPPVPS